MQKKRHKIHKLLITLSALIFLFPQYSAAQSDYFEDNSLENVLAASWQAGFCKTGGEDKAECIQFKKAAAKGLDFPAAREFTLHGLWPQDFDNKSVNTCYCYPAKKPISCFDRDKRNKDNVSIASKNLNQLLDRYMPNKGLRKHEWNKHGTCYEDDLTSNDNGADDDEYFRESIMLLQQLNASSFGRFISQNIGKTVSMQKVEAKFIEAFGKNAHNKVKIFCSNYQGQKVLKEIQIRLDGAISEKTNLKNLIQNAPPLKVNKNRQFCPSVKIIGF